MILLHQMYVPLASQGLHFDRAYTEIAPGPALAPYVRCFWGSLATGRTRGAGNLVIPDTCMDLVFDVNYSQNRVDGRFCAMDDAAHLAPARCSEDVRASFGIRFYPWAAACFAEADLRGSLGRVLNPEAHFPGLFRSLGPRLFAPDDLPARARAAEEELLRRLRPDRLRADACETLRLMIAHRGRLRVEEIAARAFISPRQLERQMATLTGAAPKLLSQLIRHQLLYREIVEGRFCALDAVERYGYADQSHLLRDFRRFHGALPGDVAARLSKRE